MNRKHEPTELERELDEVALEPVDQLVTVQQDIAVLEQRLEGLEGRRGKVAEAVFSRVHEDYSRRRAELEDKAAPLREAARGQYARLRELLDRCEAEHAAVELDREEIELRHGLGEFDDAERDSRMKAIEKELEDRGRARERAEELRERFVAAFGSREALEAQAPSAGEPTPAAADSTQPLPTLGPDQVVPPADAPPAPPPGATQVMQALKAGAAGGVRPDQTVILRSARLLPRNDSAGADAVVLALKPMVFGSDEGCDVVLSGLEPQHAQVRVSMAGFSLSRLGGEVRVNGIALEQHLLRHEDQLDIGPARFVFRES